MATYYVSIQTGSDNNDGLSPQTAWATLTKAASVAVAGDTVIIAPGTYREMLSPVNSGEPDAPIVFQGDPWATNFPNLLPGEVLITGFDNDQDAQPSRSAGIRIADLSYIVVRNLVIDGVQSDGVTISDKSGASKGHWLEDLVIRRCPTGIYRYTYKDNYAKDVVYDLVFYATRCHIYQVSVGIRGHMAVTSLPANDTVTGAVSGYHIEGCSIDATSAGITFYVEGWFAAYYRYHAGRIDADIIGGKVVAPVAFQYTHTGEVWVAGTTTITAVEVWADKLADWGSHPVTFQDVDVRYVTTLATGIGSGTKTIAGAHIEFVQGMGSGFSVGTPVWGFIPGHQQRSGVGIDEVNPLSGTKSARLAVPLVADHSWYIPGSRDVPLVVSLKARKNFAGGSVRFYLGPVERELGDVTIPQTITLTYIPRKTMLIPLRVVAEAPNYSPNHAVWIDDVIVS